jgi:hypothetical protein
MSYETYFISGHRKITKKEFETHYVPILNVLMENGDKFVVGDSHGVDHMAQKYLKQNGYPDSKITVYHMFDKPNCCESTNTVGGFKSDEERDNAMTLASTIDIAWVRPGKEESGTAQNLARRQKRIMMTELLCCEVDFNHEIGGKGEKFTKFFSAMRKHLEDEWQKVSCEVIEESKGE